MPLTGPGGGGVLRHLGRASRCWTSTTRRTATAEADANFVLTGTRRHRRDPGHRGGRAPFSEAQLLDLLGLARQGTDALFAAAARRRSASADGAPARRAARGSSWPATIPASCASSRTCCALTAMQVVSAGAARPAGAGRGRDGLRRQRRASRRWRRRGRAACRRWPTIPASASPRSAARPACAPRAGRSAAADGLCHGDGAGAPELADAADRRAWFVARPVPRLAGRPHRGLRRPGRWHAASGRRAATRGFGYDPMFLPTAAPRPSARWTRRRSTASATAPAPSPCWKRPAWRGLARCPGAQPSSAIASSAGVWARSPCASSQAQPSSGSSTRPNSARSAASTMPCRARAAKSTTSVQ